MDLLSRFLQYVDIPTTSNPESTSIPSTRGELILASMLKDELESLGLEVSFDEKGYVYAVLKGDSSIPKIGFISHLDTSPDAEGDNINIQIIHNYDGKDVLLSYTVLSPKDFPDLKNHIGKTLITTDGTTLLGADDKAGIAEIMTMLEYFAKNNEPHGDIYVAFTPDEEINRSIDNFDFTKFPVDFAYTIDGSSLGEISYENFNAATATIEIKGTSTHLGDAKGKLVNSLSIAHKIDSLITDKRPEDSSGKEGYYHLDFESGTISDTKMIYLIRDFDKGEFIKKKLKLEVLIAKLNQEYNNCITLNIKDTYYNMNELISDNYFVISIPNRVIMNLGIEPISKPIRGGTDGADLAEYNIPCPNIGTGGHNFHSIYEYIALEDMEKTVDILVGIVREIAKDKRFTRIRK
ncbi:MAG: peptidase T [Ruminococcus sp.]|nr:peptidase T [Ruminococcus sp.]